MPKRKIDENYMKTLLVEGLPYKPPLESSVSQEQRMQALDEIEGIVVASNPATPLQEENAETVTEIELVNNKTPDRENKQLEQMRNKQKESEESIRSLDEYRAVFLKKRDVKVKTSFVADKEILQVLRYILWDTESDTSLSDYVGNILTHHISQFRELINNATSKNMRKQTIPKL